MLLLFWKQPPPIDFYFPDVVPAPAPGTGTSSAHGHLTAQEWTQTTTEDARTAPPLLGTMAEDTRSTEE